MCLGGLERLLPSLIEKQGRAFGFTLLASGFYAEFAVGKGLPRGLGTQIFVALIGQGSARRRAGAMGSLHEVELA